VQSLGKIFSALFIILAIIFVSLGIMANIKHQIPPGTTPDTVAEKNAPRFTNRLASAASPYLKQHAHNPVDWYPWGPEALTKARQENKPIILSIGYSTCYWCHVMERTVFEKEDAAALMNQHFISIKVDNEERPDLDEIYMIATQLIHHQGGWPNNLLLTPDMKPFFAATYMPKESWMAMLESAAQHWQVPDNRQTVLQQADQMAAVLQNYFGAQQRSAKVILPVQKIVRDYTGFLNSTFDNRYGGFGTGMKFAQEIKLFFLLDKYRIDGDKKALHMVRYTVDNILAGGIHDHIGGGVHRYATDRKWRVPHFEKMLYNQAYMASILAGLYELTSDEAYSRALSHMSAFITRRMTDSGGAFYTALDAETDAVEGDYYVWTTEQLRTTLEDDDFYFMMSLYSREALPHFPGHEYPEGKVLFRTAKTEDRQLLADIQNKLLKVRLTRKSPRLDDKIITAWNGMMVEGYATAGHILDNQDYIDRAAHAAGFIWDRLRDEQGTLYRIYADDKTYQRAFLEDYAWLAKGMVSLYRATWDKSWLDRTQELIKQTDRYFLDEKNGGYFFTDGKENLLTRIKQGDDTGVQPSANAVLAHVFIDLYDVTGEKNWLDKADMIFSAFAEKITANPLGFGHMVHALMRKDQLISEEVTIQNPLAPEQNLSALESRDKVTAQAEIIAEDSTPTQKTIIVTLEVEEDWHINAHPATLAFLIPTVLDIQTDVVSHVDISYPEPESLQLPLGEVDVYSGTVNIKGIVRAQDEIDPETIRILLQIQACKDDICLSPSQIAFRLKP